MTSENKQKNQPIKQQSTHLRNQFWELTIEQDTRDLGKVNKVFELLAFQINKLDLFGIFTKDSLAHLGNRHKWQQKAAIRGHERSPAYYAAKRPAVAGSLLTDAHQLPMNSLDAHRLCIGRCSIRHFQRRSAMPVWSYFGSESWPCSIGSGSWWRWSSGWDYVREIPTLTRTKTVEELVDNGFQNWESVRSSSSPTIRTLHKQAANWVNKF